MASRGTTKARRLLHTGPRELFQHAFVEKIIVRFELIHLQKLGERDDVARVLVRVQIARLPQRPERVKDNLTRARKPLLEVFDGRLLLLGADDHLTRNLIIKVQMERTWAQAVWQRQHVSSGAQAIRLCA